MLLFLVTLFVPSRISFHICVLLKYVYDFQMDMVINIARDKGYLTFYVPNHQRRL